MKKVIVYTVLPFVIFALASGCGMANDPGKVPTASPMITAAPEMTTPDVGNGVVNDRDGVITPNDNGLAPAPSASARPGKTTPSASPTMTPKM